MTLPFNDFQNADLIFINSPLSAFKPMSLLSNWIKNQERDFNYEHVAQYFDGAIYTTGALGPPDWRFGKVDPEHYLSGVKYAVGRYEATGNQIFTMYQTAKELIWTPYAWEKVLALDLRGTFTFGQIKRMFDKVFSPIGDSNYPIPKRVFCSESIAIGLIRAGIWPGGEKAGKETADAISPKDLYEDDACKIVYEPK